MKTIGEDYRRFGYEVEIVHSSVFVAELRKEIPYYDERHSVRPGLTGWAQVQYPYGASVEDSYRKLEYDLFYLQNMSVLFDCAIIFQTIRTVLAGRHGR